MMYYMTPFLNIKQNQKYHNLAIFIMKVEKKNKNYLNLNQV